MLIYRMLSVFIVFFSLTTEWIGGIMSQSLAAQDLQKKTSSEECLLIPRRLLFGNPEKASPRLSPNGHYLAYLAPNEKQVLNVWVRNLLNPQEADRVVTIDNKRGIQQFIWQQDSRHILYIQDRDGDENWHLYQVSIDQPQEPHLLTPYEGARVDLLAHEPNHPERLLIQHNHRNKSEFDIYEINLKTGETTLKMLNLGGVFSWGVDNDLNIRTALSYNKEGETVLRARESDDSDWKELVKLSPQEIGGAVVGFSPDNTKFHMVSSLGGNTARLLEVDLKTGKRRLILEDPMYDLSDVLYHPTRHTLEAVGIEKDRYHLSLLDPSLKGDFETIETLLPGIFKIVSRDRDNQKWIIASVSDVRPAHFYLYDRVTRKALFLFTPQPELEKYTLSSMQPISFKACDGMTLHGYLTLPAGLAPSKLPTVLLVHGGPWTRDAWGLSPAVQWLANRGYAVLQINYRGSTGYGKAYLNAGNREWAGKMHQDLLDGKAWMIEKGYADPSKVAIYGGSYGGYAALVGLSFTPDEFCCGVDIVGPSNLITLLKTIPPYWGPLKAQMDKRLGSLEDEEFLKARSPLFKAHQIQKPLLIGQGANDPRVKQAESDQIVQLMRDKGLPVEYLLFKDEGHGFVRPENRLKFYTAAEEFLARYLGGKMEAASKEEEWKTLRQ